MRLKKLLLFFFLSLPTIILAWSGEFAISCSEDGWATPDQISSLDGAWKFGGTDNSPAIGSINKVLTLTCVSSASNPGEINAGTFYFRIIHLEGTDWYSWGGDGTNDEEIVLNDPGESIICPSGNYQSSKAAYFTATAGKTYQILFQANPNGAATTSNICILEFDGPTATITDVYDDGPVSAGEDLLVTVVSSLSPPPPDQKFWVRYVYNNGDWNYASFVGDVITSGNSVQLTIPGQSSGGTVSYYVLTTESSIVPTNSDVDNATLWLSGYTDNTYDQSLPVELSSFTSQVVNNKVQLRWTTQSELDVLGYEIQRSLNKDGPFNTIASYRDYAQLRSAGNTSAKRTYHFEDSNVLAGQTYWYKLISHDIDGSRQMFGPISITVQANNQDVQPVAGSVPSKFRLEQNFPNPFNLSTEIRFGIPKTTKDVQPVNLSVYDMNGKKIVELLDAPLSAGSYRVFWNGTDATGKVVPTGIYFYRLSTPQFVQARKMLLVK